ncbi:MAG: 50S ribosomal protein L25 [Acidobacteriota bacterium]|nr:50S ribosomal protein L25 [Acidobacteriota bacterium]
MSDLVIEVQSREQSGSNASRRLRKQDLIPAILYGGNKESVSIQVQRRTILDLLHTSAGENAVFELVLGKQRRHAMIHELQVDPLTGQVEHIDFQRINMSEKVTVQVPVETLGVPVGVKTDGGILDFVTREVALECLPSDIPTHVELDVSELHIGQHLEAKDLQLPEKVELLEEEDRVIVSIAAPRLVEEPEDEEDELLESAAEEPEVIGREEDEDEG